MTCKVGISRKFGILRKIENSRHFRHLHLPTAAVLLLHFAGGGVPV
jgi:hypothetical protein